MIKRHSCHRSMAQASNDLSTAIQQMLEAVDQSDDLKRGLRMATTAAAVCDVAAQAGLSIQPADLVRHFAQQLLDASDDTSVHNFDLCSWDAGELLWTMQNWQP